MRERSSTAKKRPRDLNELAARIVEDTTSAPPEDLARSAVQKNPHAAALGHLGGKKGGPARALRLSAERRHEIAQKAAQVRWHDRPD